MYSGKFKPTIMKKKNTKIVVDPVSEILLSGTTVDYVSEDYENGVFENKFVFTPDKKLASSCGCGISFTPKD
jgi:Fe-S cluster assembly iron-binding protein IscA